MSEPEDFMWHRLALAFGTTVSDLQERMSSMEFTQWIAYFKVEPFGYPAENWRSGAVGAAVTNAIISTVPLAKGSRRPKALKPSDFYPVQPREQRSEELTPEQQAFIERKKKLKRTAPPRAK